MAREENAAASRRHPRARVNLPAHVSIVGQAQDDDSLCVELSIGGMRVIRSRELERGTEVEISVGLGEDSKLDLEARVVWSQPVDGAHQLGLAFDDLAAAESELSPLVADLRAQRSWGPPAL